MLYNILKFVHVVSMALWFGGLVMMFVLNRLLVSKGETAAMQGLGRVGQYLSMRVFMPAVIVTLITGIGMVHTGELSYSRTWIMWGIIGLVASFFIGGVLTGGTARKLGQAAARGEIDAAGIAAAQRRIMMYSLINMIVLLTVIYLMVVKPG